MSTLSRKKEEGKKSTVVMSCQPNLV